MDTLVITLGSGLVVVVLGLVLEYKYFKPRRSSTSDDESTVRWSSAVDIAIARLEIQYPNGRPEITKMISRNSLFDKSARLCVEVTKPSGTRSHVYVKIDSTGDLLEVVPWGSKAF